MTAALLPDQTRFDEAWLIVCTNTAATTIDGALTSHHFSRGFDAAGVEHTLCGLVVPRLARPCTTDRWCPDCKDPDQ